MRNTRLGSLAVLGAIVLTLSACGRSAPEEVVDNIEGSSTPVTTGVTTTVAVSQTVTTDPPPTTQPTYVVQQGDSLSVIAQRFGVTAKELADFNGIENPDSIKIGQSLAIPPTTITPTE